MSIVLLEDRRMSHTVTIETKLKDPKAIGAACERLQLEAPVYGTARLFGGQVTGLQVKLPGWQNPVVIDTATGTASYDNFNGHWGNLDHFERFLQMYAVERAKQEARQQGYSVSEQALQDGSIKGSIIARA
jgi:hypothetical protein